MKRRIGANGTGTFVAPRFPILCTDAGIDATPVFKRVRSHRVTWERVVTPAGQEGMTGAGRVRGAGETCWSALYLSLASSQIY